MKSKFLYDKEDSNKTVSQQMPVSYILPCEGIKQQDNNLFSFY